MPQIYSHYKTQCPLGIFASLYCFPVKLNFTHCFLHVVARPVAVQLLRSQRWMGDKARQI